MVINRYLKSYVFLFMIEINEIRHLNYHQSGEYDGCFSINF